MIIHQPETLRRDGHTIVWSKIELAEKHNNFPEYLWYRVPDRFAEYISPQSDAFLVPGLLAGMYFGEDIEVRGVVSPRLAYRLAEYQFVLNFRMPEAVRQVDIKFAQLGIPPLRPKGVGATFSGGVDSLFTLWKHIPENQPNSNYRITHALFMMGFDIRYKDKEKYQFLFSRYQQALAAINIDLIPLETNLVSIIIPRMVYAHFYGPVLAGSAHFFGGLFERFFIASSRNYYQLKKWTSSSDPLSDPLLSSDTLDILHHGAAYSRADKIKEISGWDFAHDNLRVCFSKNSDPHILNCSRCEKCTRTMIPIYALGKMKAFTTFQRPFKTHSESLWLARKFNPNQGYTHEFFPLVRDYRPDFLPWLILALILGYGRYWILKYIPGFIKKWLQHFNVFLDDREEKYAFEDVQVIHWIESETPAEIGSGPPHNKKGE